MTTFENMSYNSVNIYGVDNILNVYYRRVELVYQAHTRKYEQLAPTATLLWKNVTKNVEHTCESSRTTLNWLTKLANLIALKYPQRLIGN